MKRLVLYIIGKRIHVQQADGDKWYIVVDGNKNHLYEIPIDGGDHPNYIGEYQTLLEAIKQGMSEEYYPEYVSSVSNVSK